MIVVDLGCKGHEAERSVEWLVDRFRPELLLGFDPHPELQEGVSHVAGTGATRGAGTVVVLRRQAAWTVAGPLRFRLDGTRSRPDRAGDFVVEAFDLAALIRLLPENPVVKMDVEGAEYPLLRHIRDLGLDERIDLLMVEWHGHPEVSADLAAELRCPVEPW